MRADLKLASRKNIWAWREYTIWIELLLCRGQPPPDIWPEVFLPIAWRERRTEGRVSLTADGTHPFQHGLIRFHQLCIGCGIGVRTAEDPAHVQGA